jgi:hypothetical protein
MAVSRSGLLLRVLQVGSRREALTAVSSSCCCITASGQLSWLQLRQFSSGQTKLLEHRWSLPVNNNSRKQSTDRPSYDRCVSG